MARSSTTAHSQQSLCGWHDSNSTDSMLWCGPDCRDSNSTDSKLWCGPDLSCMLISHAGASSPCLCCTSNDAVFCPLLCCYSTLSQAMKPGVLGLNFRL